MVIECVFVYQINNVLFAIFINKELISMIKHIYIYIYIYMKIYKVVKLCS